jgi:methylmalonyl-CoA/ethylmalonyl-CoA epimerase
VPVKQGKGQTRAMTVDLLGLDYLGIDHLGVAVHDLDKATATYGTLLGFKITGRETLTDRGISVAFVDTGNARIELIAPLHNNSEVSKFLEKRGEGIHHICVRVADVAQTLRELAKRGAHLINSTPQPGAHGMKVAFVHPKGTHGVLLELAQLPEGGHP